MTSTGGNKMRKIKSRIITTGNNQFAWIDWGLVNTFRVHSQTIGEASQPRPLICIPGMTGAKAAKLNLSTEAKWPKEPILHLQQLEICLIKKKSWYLLHFTEYKINRNLLKWFKPSAHTLTLYRILHFCMHESSTISTLHRLKTSYVTGAKTEMMCCNYFFDIDHHFIDSHKAFKLCLCD